MIADGFATSAQDLDIDAPAKNLEVKLVRPRAQISMYTDSDGKPAQVKPGTQEHLVPSTPQSPPSQPAVPQPVPQPVPQGGSPQ